MLLAKDIMTREVVTVKPSTPVEDIVKLMMDRHLDVIPMLDEAGKPVGVINQEHLITRLAPPGHALVRLTADDPMEALEEARAEMARALGKTAADELRLDMPIVSEDLPVSELVETFLDRHELIILVVKDERLAGVVAKRDILRAMVERSTSLQP